MESTLYLILWLAMKYSTCRKHHGMSAYLDSILERGSAKTEFLLGRTFFSELRFDGRPGFDNLCTDLAKLFAARYDRRNNRSLARTEEEQAAEVREEEFLSRLEQMVKDNPEGSLYQSILSTHPLRQYRTSMNHLATHTHVIQLFTDAIKGHSLWIGDAPAAKQNIPSAGRESCIPYTKSSWVTTELRAELAELNQGRR